LQRCYLVTNWDFLFSCRALQLLRTKHLSAIDSISIGQCRTYNA